MSTAHLPKRTLRTIVAAMVAATLLVPCGDALAASSGGASRLSVRGDDLGCTPPSVVSSGVAASTAGAGRLGTTAGAEGQSSLTVWFLKTLAETAITFAGREGLGWLMPMVTGQSYLNASFIEQQFRTVNGRLDALARQQYQDCLALMSSLTHAINRGTYDTLAGQMKGQIALLRTYRQEFNNILTALQRNGGDVNALSSKYKHVLEAMLSGTDGGLRHIINVIDVTEADSDPAARSLVRLYTQILTEEFHYDPYASHMFTPAFLSAGAAQEGYYAALIDEAVYMYSNVAHLDFTDGNYRHTNDPESVAELANLAHKYIQRWSSLFAQGPEQSNWVSQGQGHGLGTIPDGTVLDYRTQSHPLLWTIAPVGVNGEPSDPAPYYCPSTAQFCYADQYDSSGRVGDSRLVRPSPEPLAGLIARERIGGMGDWRMPVADDFSSLTKGATGGLPAWGSSHQLGSMFATKTFVSHYDGKDQTLTTIAPILVNVGSVASPRYSVLSSTDPNANKLTLQTPDRTAPAQNDVAGRLFLDHDYRPTTPPKPVIPTTAHREDQISHAGRVLATGPSRALRAADFGTRSAARRDARAPSRAAGPAAVPGPTTFSTPVGCSAASSYTVPAGVGSVMITATGGAGANGTHENKPTAPGGVGGRVTETVAVTAGDTLYIQVGGAGTGHDSRQGGIGGGGNGGLSHSGYPAAGDYAGGGGGASGVATSPNCSRWLIVAGGGGGGGAGFRQDNRSMTPHGDWSGGRGGNGCATLPGCSQAADGIGFAGGYGGKAGGSAPDNHAGQAGSSGSYVSAATAGSVMRGGNGGGSIRCCWGTGGGGGGGGGYYGGGGGGGAGSKGPGAGGGGGASFAIPGAVAVSHGLGAPGQAGSVIITPIAKAPVPITVSASSGQVGWDQPLPVTLTATLPADSTGAVTFHDNYGAMYGPAPIRHGIATVTALERAPRVGPVQLSASFSGDAHYASNRSAPVTVSVSKTTPFMNLTITGTVLTIGQQPKSLVVQMPTHVTGYVGFYDDVNGGCEGRTGTDAKCQSLGTAPVEDGYASLTQLTVPLLVGKHYLHASYGGDGENGPDSHYNPNRSNVVAVSVNPPGTSSTKRAPRWLGAR